MTKIKFGDLAINLTEKKKPTPEEQLLYIGLEHMDTNCLHITRWGSDVPIKGEKLVMHKGDVLLGKRNAYLRRAAIAPHDGVFSAHGMVLRPKDDVIDKNFFPVFIGSDYFFDEAIKISVGSLSPTINWKDLKDLEFEIPDKKTQAKIAEILWAVDRTKEGYKKLMTLTDELVKSQFMEQFLSSEARSRLGDFITQVRGVSYKPADLHLSLDNESVLLLRANNISNGLVNHDDVQYVAVNKVSAVQRIIPGDILMCGSSGSLEHVGKTAFCTDNVAGETFGAFCKIIRCKDGLNPEFLSAYFRTDEYREVIMQLANGSNINNLKNEHIDELMVPIPSISSQAGFVAFVRQSDKSKFALQQSIEKLDALYKKIISENLG